MSRLLDAIGITETFAGCLAEAKLEVTEANDGPPIVIGIDPSSAVQNTNFT